MCNIADARRSSYHGSAGTWLEPVKLTKWECPTTSAKPYWERVCDEIEKKHRRVRDSYPILIPFSDSSTPLSRTQASNNIKFKISPPTPMHKTRKKSSLESGSNENALVINGTQKRLNPSFDVDKSVRLPPATPKKVNTNLPEAVSQVLKEAKIYPRQSCPRHKDAVWAAKSLNNKISVYSQRIKSSVPRLPSVPIMGKVSCEHLRHRPMIRSQSASVTSLQSRMSQKSHKSEGDQQRRAIKAPKLVMASLLPSFARTVSTDSSFGTRESFDSEESKDFRVRTRANIDIATEIQKRDLLRVPNLSFVSSHPSFRKLSLVDSADEDEQTEVDDDSHDTSFESGDELFIAEKGVKPEKKSLMFKEQSIEKNEKTSEKTDLNIPKIVVKGDKILTKTTDYEKKYALKALYVITNRKHPEIKKMTDVAVTKTSLSSEQSSTESEVTQTRKKKLRRRKDNDKGSIDFKEIRHKLKDVAMTYLKPEQRPKSAEESDNATSISIYSSSRSTSGLSPDFENVSLSVSSCDVLQKIPQTSMIYRPQIDKCHACLFKPFKSEAKVYRELPLTTLKAIVDNPPNFRVSSSSSSSSSSSMIGALQDRVNYDPDDKYFHDTLEFDEQLSDGDRSRSGTQENESEDQDRVSFDQTNFYHSKDSLEPPSLTDKSLSPTSQLDQPRDAKSFSVQSSERSRTSTPSNQSSDSDEVHLQENKLTSSKYKVPYHMPVVWRKSLEPLRALKLRKPTTLQDREAALTAKPTVGSDSDSDNPPANKSETVKQDEIGKPADTKKDVEQVTKKKRKPKKPLVRMMTVVDKMTAFSSSTETAEAKESKKKILKRAKTTYDLTTISDDSKSDDEEDDMSTEMESSSKVEKKEEPLPYCDIIRAHRAGTPPSPIMPPEDVIQVVKECLESNFSAPFLIEKLSEEFERRIKEKCIKVEDIEEKKSLKLGLKLFRALIDSRRYLKSDLFNPNLEFSHQQPPLTNSRQLRRILPPKSFELVAPVLGMPKFQKKKKGAKKKLFARVKDDWNEEMDVSDTSSNVSSVGLVVHPRTNEGSIESDYEERKINPYAIFLKKPRRKAVVWRELRPEDMKGYDPEKTLQMRAARLMNKICKEFCEWLKKLGGHEQVIDENTLKDMFEINFTAEACKAMQVVLKEMPTVPLSLVKARHCPDASELQMTNKHIKEDLKMQKEKRRTFAFGRALPLDKKFIPPRSRMSNKWLRCDHIPTDLESMDVIWNGIMHLDSVRGFVGYLKEHPGLAPKLLANLSQRKTLPSKVIQMDAAGTGQTEFGADRSYNFNFSESDSSY